MSPRPPVTVVRVYRVNQILSKLSLGKYWLPPFLGSSVHWPRTLSIGLTCFEQLVWPWSITNEIVITSSKVQRLLWALDGIHTARRKSHNSTIWMDWYLVVTRPINWKCSLMQTNVKITRWETMNQNRESIWSDSNAMQWSGKWFRDSWVIMPEVRSSEMFTHWAKGFCDVQNTNQTMWRQFCEDSSGITPKLPHVTLSLFHQSTSYRLVTESSDKWLYLREPLGRRSCPCGL